MAATFFEEHYYDYVPPTPEEDDTLDAHEIQDALFEAGCYDEDEQQLFVRMHA